MSSSPVARTMAGIWVSSGALRCPPAAFPHDQLVLPGPGLADDDRLQQAYFLDGVGQLVQRFLVEHLTGLAGVGR